MNNAHSLPSKMKFKFEKVWTESEPDEDCAVQSNATILKKSETFLD